MSRRIIGRSEVLLLLVTIVFQITSLVTLLRVATGVAAVEGAPTNSTSLIVIPSSLNQTVVVPSTTPQFQSPSGSDLSSSFLLAVVFIAANIVVVSMLAYLYRKRRMKLFSVIVSLFLIFNVTELYMSFILGLYSSIPIIFALAATVVTMIAAIRKSSRLINALALFLALELGSSFAVLLQAPLNWIIPAVYAVFDIYAIYFGKLGKLVKQVGNSNDGSATRKVGDSGTSPPEKDAERKQSRWPDFGLLTINLDRIEIGMADIAFYSMVPAVALVLRSIFAFAIVMIAVDVGLVVSFYAFRNKEVAPGLPIPILSGLGALLLLSLV